jgi:Subtilisin inhibitor-like
MKIPATSAAAVAAMATVLMLATACGSQHAAGGGSPSPTHPPVSLTIAVRPTATGNPQRWTLSCDPAGGTLPHPAAACAALARVSDPFAPVRRGMMCPMIYAGPQTATIDGTWHGKSVAAKFSRVDGCQTARWSRIAAVFGPYANPGAVP